MFRPTVLAAFAALLVVLAGCLGGAPKTRPPTPAVEGSAVGDLSTVLIQDHGHTDPTLHVARSANLQLVGYSDLAVAGGNDASTAMDVLGDYAYFARVGNVSGMTIADVKDPAHPKVVGHVDVPNTYGSDVRVSADGNYVFFSTQAVGAPSPVPVPAVTIPTLDPTQAANGPTNFGITVVNAKDKAHPAIESVFTMGTRGFHSVHYHRIDGVDYVFGCSYKIETTATGQTTTDPAYTAVVILRLVDTPAGKVLQPVSEYSVPWDPAGPLAFPDRLTVAESPIDHKPYMLVSYWNAGMRVVDVSDPSKPVELGAFTDFKPDDGNVHSSAPFPHLFDGHWMAIVGPEFGARKDEAPWRVVDITNFKKITLLGEWKLPPGTLVIDRPYLWSPHEFDIVGDVAFFANDHGGLWIVDFEPLFEHWFGEKVGEDVSPFEENATANGTASSDAGALPGSWAQLSPIGVASAHGSSTDPNHADVPQVLGYYVVAQKTRSKQFGGFAPDDWSAQVRKGLIFIDDVESGLEIVKMDKMLPDASGPLMKGK